MEQVRMPYRIYKQRYAECQTLDDYDADSKTITVIIPKRQRTHIYDKNIWRKIPQGYELIVDPNKQVILRGSAGISQTFEAIWLGDLTLGARIRGQWNGWRSKCFSSRADAFNFLLSLA